MPDRSYLRVTGYGGPADSISRCLRVSDGVADIGLDPFRSDQSRFAVLLDGIWYPGDSGSPMTVFKGDEPILLGISTDYVSGETAFGTLIFVVRLRPDDPWLLEQMPTPPEELP